MSQTEPEKESVNWVNMILNKVWLNYGEYATDMIKEQVNTTLKNMSPKFEVRITKFDLGQVSPTMNNMKIYKMDNNILLLDTDFSMNSDLSILVRVKAGVPVHMEVKDLIVKARARIFAKLLPNQAPFLEYFYLQVLEDPKIDVSIKPVGVDIMEVPGLSEWIRSAITEQTAAILRYPNKLLIPLNVPMPEAEADLQSRQDTIPKNVAAVDVTTGGFLEASVGGLSKLGEGLADVGSGVVSGVGAVGSGVATGVGVVGSGVVSGVGAVGSGVATGVGVVGSGMVSGVGAVGSGVAAVGSGMVSGITSLGNIGKSKSRKDVDTKNEEGDNLGASQGHPVSPSGEDDEKKGGFNPLNSVAGGFSKLGQSVGLGKDKKDKKEKKEK